MAESHSSSACLESAVEPAPSCMLATPIGLPDGWMITRVDSPEMEHSHFQVVDKPMLLQESHTYCELYLQTVNNKEVNAHNVTPELQTTLPGGQGISNAQG